LFLHYSFLDQSVASNICQIENSQAIPTTS
jgi:hypothetical protein